MKAIQQPLLILNMHFASLLGLSRKRMIDLTRCESCGALWAAELWQYKTIGEKRSAIHRVHVCSESCFRRLYQPHWIGAHRRNELPGVYEQ